MAAWRVVLHAIVMGMYSGVFVEAPLEDLRSRVDDVPSDFVRVADGCEWAALDDIFVEPDEQWLDGEGHLSVNRPAVAELARLSDALDVRVLLLLGDTRSDWFALALFEGGQCIRRLEASPDGWKVGDETPLSWEAELVANASDLSEYRNEEDLSTLSALDRAVVEDGQLRDGARLPRVLASKIPELLKVDAVLHGRERVRLRPKTGFWARLFGG